MHDLVTIEREVGFLWTAVRTRPRCEKIVGDYCSRHSLICYLPLRRRAKRYQRRTVESLLPMFPGYVFVRLGHEGTDRNLLLQSHKIATVLDIDEGGEATLLGELRELQLLEQADIESELVIKPELAAGQSVLITSGPLEGSHGIVEFRRNKTRVTINVEMLGQSVTAELDVGEVGVNPE